MVHCNFSPASPDEDIVYGACRPGYHATPASGTAVEEWISHMRAHDIGLVCCLLSGSLDAYDGLLETYERAFGPENVCHAPIEDFSVVTAQTLHEGILPFLREADDREEKVVVHCSAGSGRTGHVLVLWLVHERGYELETAIQTVKQTGRTPLEAATRERLANL